MRLPAILLALVAVFAFGGCTTFSLSKQSTLIHKNDTSATASFQRGGEAFQEQFRKAGWLREGESQSRTRAFMNLLSKGWRQTKDETEHSKNSKDAIDLYLEKQVQIAGNDPVEISARLEHDISEAMMAMVDLNALAEPLLTPRASLQAAQMRSNVMALERALLAAHKAQSLFEGAVKKISPSLDAEHQASLSARLAANAKEVDRMKLLADTLNTMRLQIQPVG